MVGHMVGQKLAGRYRLLKQLGQGGFGQAYLAEDEHLPDEYQCVVKRFHMGETHAEDTLRTAKRLFDAEAKALHRLGHHEQLPKLLAHFEDEGEFYLVEEYIPGPGLDQELQNGMAMPEAEVIELLTDLLSVLGFVHDKQVIHRDIKPSNIIRRDADHRLVLIDFGAVKQVTTQMQSGTMRPHTVVIGTPGYMPSEQFRGSPKPSSDVYAVGMIAIQAITGLNPSLGELPEDDETGEIQWRENAQVSEGLANILDKMVRYDFRQRYRNAQDTLEEVLNLGQETPDKSTVVQPVVPPTEVSIPLPPQETTPAIKAEELPETHVQQQHANAVDAQVEPPPIQPLIQDNTNEVVPTTINQGKAKPTDSSPPQIKKASSGSKKKLGLLIGGGVAIAASGLFAVLGTPHIASICPSLGNCTPELKAKADYKNALSSLEEMDKQIKAAKSIEDLETLQKEMKSSLDQMQTISSNNSLAIASEAKTKAGDYAKQLNTLEARIKTEKDGKNNFNGAVAKASEAFKEKDKAESIAAKDDNIAKWQAAIDLLKKVQKPTFVYEQAQTKKKDYEAHVKNINNDIETILAEERAWQQQQAATRRAEQSYQAPAYTPPAPQPSYASSGSYQEPAYQAPAPSYQAPAPSYQEPAYQAPAPSYQAPAPAPAPAPAQEPLWGGPSDPQAEPLW